MASFNRVLFMGNLTRDPDVRTTPSGQTVVELGLAANRSYTAGGPGGEKREEVTFIDVSFWGRQGELIAQYLKKGDPIFIEGRLTYRQWEKDGQKRSKLSVTGENFQFIGGRREGSSGPQQERSQSSGGYSSGAGGGGGGGGGGDAGMEGFDEVPF